jgi:hypothetical protein
MVEDGLRLLLHVPSKPLIPSKLVVGSRSWGGTINMTYMNITKTKKIMTCRIARSFGLVARVEGYTWVVEELHQCFS